MPITGGNFREQVEALRARSDEVKDDLKRQLADLWQDFTPDAYARIDADGVTFGWFDYAGTKRRVRQRFRENWRRFLATLDEPLAEAARRLVE